MLGWSGICAEEYWKSVRRRAMKELGDGTQESGLQMLGFLYLSLMFIQKTFLFSLRFSVPYQVERITCSRDISQPCRMGNLDSPATKGAQFSAQKWKVVISLQGEI